MIACIMLLMVQFSPVSAGNVPTDEGKLKLTTVCIDPGHGGKDAGCVSKDRKTYEKDLTLDIAKRLSAKISSMYPDVRVVMTRTTDKYVTLGGRADIANEAGANLFISIHINSNTSSSPSGYSAHVLGQSSQKNRDLFNMNLELCKRENAVVLMEEDKTRYKDFETSDPESSILFNLMQTANLDQSLNFAETVSTSLVSGPIRNNRGVSQDPFWVLWSTTMPSVLLELGFMSNTNDLAALRDSGKREQLADRLMNAFSAFKTRYDASTSSSGSAPSVPDKSAGMKQQNEDKGTVSGSVPTNDMVSSESSVKEHFFGVQIMALPKPVSLEHGRYKGHAVRVVKVGHLYKYVAGECDNAQAAKAAVAGLRKSFPGCFPVEVQDGTITLIR